MIPSMLSLFPHSFIRNPNAGVTRETSEYINFLTLVKRWLALLNDFFSDFFFFLEDKEAPVWPSSRGLRSVFFFFHPAVIPATLTIHWSVVFLCGKRSKRKRKYINLRSLQRSDMKSVSFFERPPCPVYLKCGEGGEAWQSVLQKECVVNATLMAKLVRAYRGGFLLGSLPL